MDHVPIQDIDNTYTYYQSCHQGEISMWIGITGIARQIHDNKGSGRPNPNKTAYQKAAELVERRCGGRGCAKSLRKAVDKMDRMDIAHLVNYCEGMPKLLKELELDQTVFPDYETFLRMGFLLNYYDWDLEVLNLPTRKDFLNLIAVAHASKYRKNFLEWYIIQRPLGNRTLDKQSPGVKPYPEHDQLDNYQHEWATGKFDGGVWGKFRDAGDFIETQTGQKPTDTQTMTITNNIFHWLKENHPDQLSRFVKEELSAT